MIDIRINNSLDKTPVKIDNRDVLNVPEQWNNIRAFYIYAGTPENPQLILDFKLEISAYQPSDYLPEQTTEAGIPGWQQNAVDDQQKFTSLNFQLNQTDDKKS